MPDPWDEFIRRAQQIDSEQREKWEIAPKVKTSQRLSDVREAVLNEAAGWQGLVKKWGFTSSTYPIIPVRGGQIPLKNWIDQSPASDTLRAFQAIWTENGLSVSERIRAFAELFPRDVISGTGSRLTMISQLLMALNVEQYPPYKTNAFKEAYERTGYDKPVKNADEAALYEHALGFLDRFIDEAAGRGLNLRHRLDAQSVVWLAQDKHFDGARRDEDDPPEWRIEPTEVDLHTLANDLWLPVGFLENIQTLLEDKLQVIFQGPPGTGKTYVAQKLAEHLAGSKERVTLVQFHPSYAYEDFVQGFRPALVNGQPGFKLRDGPLLKAAERARQAPDGKHFLVIDEINRGNLAKVFGELYFLLEYRDSEMDLQYSDQDKKFSLPENLYIIGTMNTADRSIALVDLALRRRFYFVEFHPDDDPVKSVLRSWLSEKATGMEWVADVVERANDRLREDRHAAIGPSYFMKDDIDDDMVKRIWRHSVLPYIEERLYGQQEEVENFKLDGLIREVAGEIATTAMASDVSVR